MKFKDYFDLNAARTLGQQVARVHTPFDLDKFVKVATRDLATLEFHGRVARFSDALRQTLPESIPRALGILEDSLPPILDGTDSVTDGYLQWPLGHFVGEHGLDDFEASMHFMVELTQRFSAEFAVRPFVDTYPDETLAILLALTEHQSAHVRRWCSEGPRPRLPWGLQLRALVADPAPTLPILEALLDDDEEYVRRSVANHINDIAKDHPARVVTLCRRWSRPNRARLIKHALRTLIKAGDPDALALIGYGPPRAINAELVASPTALDIGASTQLSLSITNAADVAQPLLVDFAVDYVRQRGCNRKVFKWKTVELDAGATTTMERAHAFKENSIRRLYPGPHEIHALVNGSVVASTSVDLR